MTPRLDRTPYITMLLMTISAIVVAVVYSYDSVRPVQFLYISEYYGRGLSEVTNGELWRLFTPTIFHQDVFHWLFNAMAIWEFGKILESYLGHWRYAAFVFIVSAPSNLAQFYWGGFNFGGLSGVILAMLGFMWVVSWRDKTTQFYIPRFILYILAGFFIAGWLGVFGRNMANMQHTAGFCLGMICGWIWSWKRASR